MKHFLFKTYLAAVLITTSSYAAEPKKELAMIKPGLYEHSSGKLYQVLGVARHSETLEELVVYQQLYGDFGLWVRPFEMFTGTVQVNCKTVQRFTYKGETMTKAPSFQKR